MAHPNSRFYTKPTYCRPAASNAFTHGKTRIKRREEKTAGITVQKGNGLPGGSLNAEENNDKADLLCQREEGISEMVRISVLTFTRYSNAPTTKSTKGKVL